MRKSEQYLRSPKKNFTTENFFGVSDAEFCADFSDTTHWAETGSKKNAPKKTAQNGLKWAKTRKKNILLNQIDQYHM